MNRTIAILVGGLWLVAFSPAAVSADQPQLPAESATMTDHLVTGTFAVELTPNSAADAPVGSMAISKTFNGPLDGTSVGQMLAVRTGVDGSAGYVAMERVTARLAGHSGTFALQHSGTMDRGSPTLIITVVPDSGTDGLAGISGSMLIRIDGGQHYYDFTYRLPAG
jgi:hypothetical protein